VTTWVLVWTVLVLGAVAFLFLLGRRLWRQAKALTAELGQAGHRLTDLTDRLGDLTPPDPRDSGRLR